MHNASQTLQTTVAAGDMVFMNASRPDGVSPAILQAKRLLHQGMSASSSAVTTLSPEHATLVQPLYLQAYRRHQQVSCVSPSLQSPGDRGLLTQINLQHPLRGDTFGK
jgi:hypothetical protein